METQGLSTPAKPQRAARDLDLVVADDFLTTIDPKQRITFQTFADNRKRKDNSLACIRQGPIAEYVSHFNKLAARGAGIYFCLCGTDRDGRKLENVVVFRGFWVDLDGAPLDPVLKWTLKPSIVTETSPGRYHVFWLFDRLVHIEQLSLDQYATIQLKLANLFGGDRMVADATHVARLPGSWHQKNPDAPFRVRVAHGDWEGLRYTVEDFERELAGVEVAQRPSSAKPPAYRKTGGDPAPSKEAAIACLRNIKNVPGSGFDDPQQVRWAGRGHRGDVRSVRRRRRSREGEMGRVPDVSRKRRRVRAAHSRQQVGSGSWLHLGDESYRAEFRAGAN